jgi:hypothetical protein
MAKLNEDKILIIKGVQEFRRQAIWLLLPRNS